MTSVSSLQNILKKGLYGDDENKKENNLIKIKEIKNLLIIQIVQYKNSLSNIKDIKIDGINFPEEVLNVSSNNDIRILWCGPKNWLLISNKKEVLKNVKEKLSENEFAVTDLSHSRTVIELKGSNSKEVLKRMSF